MRRWWENWSAPRRLRRVVEQAIAGVMSAAAALGVPTHRYAFEWERALVAQANNPAFAEGVAARADTDARGPGQVRRSHLARAVAALRNAFVWDPRVPVFWAGITKIAELWGVEERQARALLRQAQEAGILHVVRRWREDDHEPEEPRTNVYVLTLPEQAWRFYSERRPKPAESGHTRRAEGAAAAPEAVERAQQARARLPRGTSGPTSPAPSSAPRAARSDLWLARVFAEVRAEVYSDGDHGTAKPERLERVQEQLRDEAAACRAWAEQRGLAPPNIDELAVTLARDLIRGWVRRPGTGDFLRRPENAHRMGFFPDDATATALAAVAERWREQRKREARPVALRFVGAPAAETSPRALDDTCAPAPAAAPLQQAPRAAARPVRGGLLDALEPAQRQRLEALMKLDQLDQGELEQQHEQDTARGPPE